MTVGGSATTDGGRGALEALGGHFTSRTADLRELRRRLRGVKLSLACDVRIPLVGPERRGAHLRAAEGRVAGAGRGARGAPGRTGRGWPAAPPIAIRPPSRWPAPAAGWPGGLWAFAGAALRPGAALVLDTIGFDAAMRASFAVVTGEGRWTARRCAGKAVFEVATRCRQSGVPCYAVPGVDAARRVRQRLMNVEVEAAARNGTARRRRPTSSARRDGLARRAAAALRDSASERTTAS